MEDIKEESWEYWYQKNEVLLQELSEISLEQLQEVIAKPRESRTGIDDKTICVLSSIIDLSGYRIRRLDDVCEALEKIESKKLKIMPSETRFDKEQDPTEEKSPNFHDKIMDSDKKRDQLKSHFGVLQKIKIEITKEGLKDFKYLDGLVLMFNMFLIALNKPDKYGSLCPI